MTICSRQNLVLGRKKKCVLLLGLISIIHLIHSYVHSGDSSGRFRKGLYCHWQQLRTFPGTAPFGATPAVAVKESKRIFFIPGRKQKILSYEWTEAISPKESRKDNEGSFGPKGHSGIKNIISGNLLWSFVSISFSPSLFYVWLSSEKALFWQPFLFYWLIYLVLCELN